MRRLRGHEVYREPGTTKRGNATETQALREEVRKLRREIVDAKVERAAKHLELMRNWMMVYTAILTLVISGFALSGYLGLKDIEANRKNVEATANHASEVLQNLQTKVKQQEADFNGVAAENAEIVQRNKNVLSGFQFSLNDLEGRHRELKTAELQVEGRFHGLSDEMQKLQSDVRNTSSSLQTSMSSLSSEVQSSSTSFGNVLSTSLNIPTMITSMGLSAAAEEKTVIRGRGFGASPGQVLVGVMNSSMMPPGSSLNLPTPQLPELELPKDAITEWSDTSIVCPGLPKFFNKTFNGDFYDRKRQVLIQVVSSSGTRSNVYSLVPAVPAPPSMLHLTVR
jgi:hypothetical protein